MALKDFRKILRIGIFYHCVLTVLTLAMFRPIHEDTKDRKPDCSST